MGTFPSIVEILNESEHGIARIEHFEVNEQASRMTAFRRGDEYIASGKYARLRVNEVLVMSDTRMEHITNLEFVHRSHGHVLVAGLGLGMILHPVLKKESVLSVTVVEKYDDVIKLVQTSVRHPKLTIVPADIYEWKPVKGTKFDTIYFDIWAEQSTDTLEDMRKLHCRFRPYKNPTGWMDSWRRGELKYAKSRNRWR